MLNCRAGLPPARPLHLPATSNETNNVDKSTWRALAYFNLHRLFIATLFTALMYSPFVPGLFDVRDQVLAGVSALVYLGLTALSVLLRGVTWIPFLWHVSFALATDIVLILLLMCALGGIGSGIGILLVITIGGGAVLLPGRLAILFAAVATLCLFGIHLQSVLEYDADLSSWTQVGLLGLGYFGVAILGYFLSRRARESQVLAEKRSVDLANLGEVNALIIQRMRTGTLVIDADNRIRQMNESAWQLTGMPNTHRRDLNQVAPELLECLERWRETGERAAHPVHLARTAPAVIPRFAALSDEVTPNVALVFLEDTSVVSKRAEELNLTSLGRLAASIAHEIRNPLGAISHAGQLLNESDLQSDNQRLVEIIRTQSKRMNEIVENVLQISRRERARPETLKLAPWVAEFVEEFSAAHELDDATLSCDSQSEALEVLVDPSHLRQVLTSLCQNALRYGHSENDEARIVLRCGWIEPASGIVLDVCDQGPGIEPEQVSKIFEPFYTSDSRGSGLGLFIARQLCEANQMGLEYIPIPTGGSCFRISFAMNTRSMAASS